MMVVKQDEIYAMHQSKCCSETRDDETRRDETKPKPGVVLISTLTIPCPVGRDRAHNGVLHRTARARASASAICFSTAATFLRPTVLADPDGLRRANKVDGAHTMGRAERGCKGLGRVCAAAPVPPDASATWERATRVAEGQRGGVRRNGMKRFKSIARQIDQTGGYRSHLVSRLSRTSCLVHSRPRDVHASRRGVAGLEEWVEASRREDIRTQ